MVDHRFYTRLGPLSLVELISGADVEIPEGQFGDVVIENAAPISTAGASEISFYQGRRPKTELANCNAAACLVSDVNASFVGASNSIAVISKNPRADFAHILGKLYQPIGYESAVSSHPGVTLSSGAVVGQGASIGKGSIIGPNAVIGPNVSIGKNAKIGANAVIEYATLGDNCVVQSGAVIGGSGFGVAMGAGGCVDVPHVGTVEIGNEVSIGCQTTIDRAMFGATKIGDGCKFDNLVQVAHNVQIGTNCIFAAHVGLSGSCVIGNNVVMGGRVGIPDHITIGDGVTMAANSATMRDITDGGVWSGVPAQPIRQHMREISALKKLVQKKKK